MENGYGLSGDGIHIFIGDPCSLGEKEYAPAEMVSAIWHLQKLSLSLALLEFLTSTGE